MLGSYLSTFLDSFLSKEICYNLNSEQVSIQRGGLMLRTCSLSCWALLLIGIKWVYPSSGVFFSTKGYRYVIAKLEHFDDQETEGKRNVELFFINFAHRVKASDNICLVYTKFDALSYGYRLSLFGGGLSLYMVRRTFSTRLDRPLLM